MSVESDEDGCDSIYANDSTSDLLNIKELLKTKPLKDLLKDDKEKCKERDKEKLWYHGRITRDVAEDVLKRGLVRQDNIDGLFLVRESSFSSSSFVLSLCSKGTFYHFQINEVKTSHFSIDAGPTIHGLDRLIQNYQENAQGLPTVLTQFCRCKQPPDEQRFAGVTNLLHRAVLENIPETVEEILKSKYCPQINAKSEWGTTALHEACTYGFEDVADLLIRNDANVNSLDKDGQTPLHRCCTSNNAGVISILIQGGNANVNARNPKSGWIPIHQAAYKGHLECIKILLDFHSPYLPRADDDDDTTPLDLAENYEHKECYKEIENFECQKVTTHKYDWFHPEINRPGAQKLLELKGLVEGLFLVRSSKKNPDWHVLTLCHDQKVFNYEIKTKNYRDRHMYYIDDGPFYKSLEHLIHYYSYHNNGLPCSLTMSVNTTQELIQISQDDEYFNLIETQRMPDKISPALPPRPETLDPVYTESTKKPPIPQLSPPPSPSAPNKSPPPPPNHPPPFRQQSIQSGSKAEAAPIELKKIDRKLLSLGKEIGQGEFGQVVKGTYKKKTGHVRAEKINVAIKLFHKTAINNTEDFLKEARTMQQLKHVCIVNFLGIAETDSHELMLVEEYIAMGSMLDFLLDHPNDVRKDDLYVWASQIALGMTYLEEMKMVHRDLAARNILLQDKHKAKISDFGLSRAVGSNSDYYKATTGGRWPIKWYAPECVNYGHFSHASDVWSFGVTLWEMFSYGEQPYDNMKGIEVIKFIEEEKRLQKPKDCPDVAYRQMLKCWTKEPKQRPKFSELNLHFAKEDIYSTGLCGELMKEYRK